MLLDSKQRRKEESEIPVFLPEPRAEDKYSRDKKLDISKTEIILEDFENKGLSKEEIKDKFEYSQLRELSEDELRSRLNQYLGFRKIKELGEDLTKEEKRKLREELG